MQPFVQAPAPMGNQFVNDFSGQDLSAQLGHVTANGNMTIQFFWAQIRIDDPTDPSNHGSYKTVLCVKKRPHGDRHTEAVRIITERVAQQLYPREFAFFKQNQDVPTDGTPLHELPGISQSQIGILLISGIRCVEDLVRLSQDQVSQMGMDANQAYSTAKRWWEAKAANGELIRDAAKDAATAAELTRLRESDARKDVQIAEMKAQLDLLTRMGLQPSAPATPAIIGGQGAVTVDADDLPEVTNTELFAGAQVVDGNDDLDDPDPAPSDPAPSGLPGLDRKKR